MKLRFDKNECLDALRKEHVRLNQPLGQLCYNGQQALEHVTRLLGGADEQQAEEPVAAEPENQATAPATSGYDTRYLNGYWQLIQLDSEGEPGAAVELPALDPSGEGWWKIVMVDEAPVVWQGGQTEAIPCEDFFPTAESAAGAMVPHNGTNPEAALLPGMRLPTEDTLRSIPPKTRRLTGTRALSTRSFQLSGMRVKERSATWSRQRKPSSPLK